VVALNWLVIWINFLIQQFELKRDKIAPRHSIISGTKQVFLHWQDFYLQKLENTIFLSAVFVIFWHLWVFTGYLSLSNVIIGIAIMLANATIFLIICAKGKEHKPDWGFPAAGKISVGGWYHVIYQSFGVGAVALCAWHIFITGYLTGWAVWMFFFFLAGFALSLIMDIRAGHFAKLKKTT